MYIYNNNVITNSISSILLALSILTLSCTLPFIKPITDSIQQISPIDKHALSAPDSVETSLTSLASYLTCTAHSDRDKARALYCWMTNNIIYDLDAVNTGAVTNVSANDVLRTRKAVCGGYAGLYKGLADLCGLEVKEINGYAKGVDYYPGYSYEGRPFNHTWIAVRIDSVWQLIDPTWGAGYINEKGIFIHKFNEYYFLAPPSEMIYSHFPQSPEWQLLDNPISRTEFQEYVYLKWTFFQLGMKLLSHKKGTIHTNGSDQITLGAPPIVDCIARIEYDGIITQAATIREKDQIIIKITPPKFGEKTLRIYAKPTKKNQMYNLAAIYRITN